jgi:hypothetical protein
MTTESVKGAIYSTGMVWGAGSMLILFPILALGTEVLFKVFFNKPQIQLSLFP